MTWQMKQFIHCWHAQNFENKKQWCDFKAENKTIHSYQLIWLHKIWKDNGLWYIWGFEQVQKTKLQPRSTQNCVAMLAEPMLLSSTVNIYKPSQCSQIQQRIERISYLSTRQCYIQVDSNCYYLSLCFWTDKNESFQVFWQFSECQNHGPLACSCQQSINALKRISKSFCWWLKIYGKWINKYSQWTILQFYTYGCQTKWHWI